VRQISRLENAIQEYDWGSRTAIASLLGQTVPSARPQAELWMGAHPSAPSQVEWEGRKESLAEAIRRDPAGALGPRAAERFGAQLPFLLKVLAADEPLSLQAHPGAAQAEEGFARENALGIPLDAPERSYRDPRHKPELLCALTPFCALKGFRRTEEVLELMGRISPLGLVDELRGLRSDPSDGGLAQFFERLLTLPPERRERVVEEAVRRAAELEETDPAFPWLRVLAERHPREIGVLAPLLLNVVQLEPGQAFFLPTGELHCYLRGAAIEIMANSDNVLRGGLTAKHVDVPELLRALDFSGGVTPVLHAEPVARGEEAYRVPVVEFALSVIHSRESETYESPTERSVEILICTEGASRVRATEGGGELRLERGEAAFVPAAAGPYRIAGCATLYKASVPGEAGPPARRRSP
jgi:mannose-6-phosphate isomerase